MENLYFYYVDPKDLENENNHFLPVRNGCGAAHFGGCGCMGTCFNVVGLIERDKYEKFIKNFKTVEDFLAENLIINGNLQ